MKRIFSLLMALCLLFCGVLPVMAMENPASAAVIGESGGTPNEAPATPTDAEGVCKCY